MRVGRNGCQSNSDRPAQVQACRQAPATPPSRGQAHGAARLPGRQARRRRGAAPAQAPALGVAQAEHVAGEGHDVGGPRSQEAVAAVDHNVAHAAAVEHHWDHARRHACGGGGSRQRPGLVGGWCDARGMAVAAGRLPARRRPAPPTHALTLLQLVVSAHPPSATLMPKCSSLATSAPGSSSMPVRCHCSGWRGGGGSRRKGGQGAARPLTTRRPLRDDPRPSCQRTTTRSSSNPPALPNPGAGPTPPAPAWTAAPPGSPQWAR